MTSIEDTVAELAEGQGEFKDAITKLTYGQEGIAATLVSLDEHVKDQNGRIGELETTAVQNGAVLNTLKYLIPIGLTFAGLLSGVIFGIVTAVTN